MSNDETRDLVVQAPNGVQISDTAAGTLVLAQMSEQEFSTKLAILKKGRERIATIQRELMEPDVDYGVIPGTPKPTLYKAGAEKLCDFYHYAADFEAERTTCADGTAPTINYTTKCFLHLGDTSGPIIAVGQGSANSWERKHRYRSAERACPECGALKTIIKGKDEYEKDLKYKGGFLCFAKKGGCGAKFTKDEPRIVNQQLGEVENPDQWDLDNTLLKMSEKRAFVDGALRATATSGLFTQDVEDLPEFERRPEPPQTATNGASRSANVDTETGEIVEGVVVAPGEPQPAMQRAPERAPKAVVPAADATPTTAAPGPMTAAQKSRIWLVARDGLGWDVAKLEEMVVGAFDGREIGSLNREEANQLSGLLAELMDQAAKEATA